MPDGIGTEYVQVILPRYFSGYPELVNTPHTTEPQPIKKGDTFAYEMTNQITRGIFTAEVAPLYQEITSSFEGVTRNL